MEAIQLKLLELQDHDIEAKELKSKELPEVWVDVENVSYHEGLPYILDII